ncbi:MAG: PQQ-binding-like beta-propeller repeat protein, partial [Cyclobacteriaceae bacterium]
ENMIYFISSDSNIYGLNANNGRKKWEYTTKGEKRFQKEGLYGFNNSNKPIIDEWDLFHSSPLIYKERVIVGGGDHYIYGLDAKDASLMFRFVANEIVHASITGAYGHVFIGSWDGFIYALEAISGVEVWRQNVGLDSVDYKLQGIQGTPAAADSLLIVPSRDSNLYALDIVSGDIVWKYANDSSRILSSPAIADGKVYFTTFDDFALKCLDIQTGKLLFESNTGAFNMGSPVIAGDNLILTTLLGEVQIYNRFSGEKIWQWRTETSQNDPNDIVTPEGSLDLAKIFPSDDYDDFKAGINKILSNGAIVSQPVVYGDLLYITSTDSTLYVLE